MHPRRIPPVAAFVLAFSLLAVPAARACLEAKFVNKTGVSVNDLHIVFSRGVSITNPGAFGDNSAENTRNTHDLIGGTVGVDGSTTIEVTSSPCDNIQIRKWWWTVGGVQQGAVHEGEPRVTVSTSGGNTSGGGLIRVRADGIDHFFNIPPGMTPVQTLIQFRAFLAPILGTTSQPLMRLVVDLPQTVAFSANVLGDPALELSAQLMNPDGNQQISVSMSQPVIPGASPIGVGGLALAIAACGALLLWRRRATA